MSTIEDELRMQVERYALARQHRDEAIRDAARAGMTRRAIAEIVGLSYARVQQIIAAETSP